MRYETDAYAKEIRAKVMAVMEGMIVLDDTVFYPTGGGQPGDTGALELPDGRRIAIADTRRAAWDRRLIVHVPVTPVAIEPGTEVIAQIDWLRRYRHMRMYTCLHLLATIIDAPVTGSAISADKGRVDFDLPEPTLERAAVTERLAELIGRRLPVTTQTVSAQALQAMPGLVRGRSVMTPAFDGPVRIVEIAGVDRQTCGGTHVANTTEIGAVHCARIEKKSQHNRRVVIEFDE